MEDTELDHDDFSVATPEVTYTRGDEENNNTTTGNQKAVLRQVEMSDERKGQLNVS